MNLPRRLTAREREVLDFLVSIDGPAAKVLRSQAATAAVTGECECGCGAVSLQVDREHTVPAAVRWPIETSNDPEEPEETQWLMLWSEGGWISGIELSWISAEPPRGLPSPEGFLPPSKQSAPKARPPTSNKTLRQRWRERREWRRARATDQAIGSTWAARRAHRRGTREARAWLAKVRLATRPHVARSALQERFRLEQAAGMGFERIGQADPAELARQARCDREVPGAPSVRKDRVRSSR